MKVRTLGAWVLIGSLLLDSIFLPIHIGFDFRLQYIVFVLAIIIYPLLFKIVLDLKILGIIFFIGIFLLVTPMFTGTPLVGSIRQLLLIFTCATPFYFLLSSFDFHVDKLFKIYLKVSLIISLASILQFLSFYFHFKPGYDFSYLGFDMSRLDPGSFRAQGWMMEPSFLAYILMPASFFSMIKLFNVYQLQIDFKKMNCSLILISMLVTGSLIAYVSILIILLVILFTKYSFLQKPATIVLIVIVGLVFSYGVYQVPTVKVRVDDSLSVLEGDRSETVNLSTFHFFNNLSVANQVVKKNPWMGVGFGNYYVAYDKYAEPAPNDDITTPDGASLFFRLVTETGLPFTLLCLWFVFRFRLKSYTLNFFDHKDMWVINNGVFVLLIMRLVRMPHYTALGLPFFILVYYFTFSRSRIIGNNLNRTQAH